MGVKKRLSGVQFDVLLFILILSPFVYIAGAVLMHGVPDVTLSGDGALLEMSTRSLFSRGILLGPYSRFLFFHPGPLYYLIRYPLYMLLGQRNSSFLIVTSLISMASLFGGWYVVRKLTSKFTSILFSAVFALFLINTDKALWLSEWNPHIIMLPMILFTVVVAAVGCRNFKYLSLCVIAGSFVAQTHIGGIPVLFFSFLFALLCICFPSVLSSGKTEIQSGYRKRLLVSFALLLLLWAPPIYEEISAETQGNISMIREFFAQNEPDQSIETALEPWVNMLTDFELKSFLRSLCENGMLVPVAYCVIAFRVLFLAMGYSLLRRKGTCSFLCSLNLICILLHGVTLYSVSQIRGEINPYLLEWMKIIAPLSLFAILASLFVFIGVGSKAEIVKKYSRWIFVLLILYASVALPLEARGYFRTDPDESRYYVERVIQQLATPLQKVMDQQPDNYFVIKLESQDCWSVMFGLMNELEKKGYKICLEDNDFFVSTEPPCDASIRILHLGTLTDRGGSNPTLIARYDNVGIILQ